MFFAEIQPLLFTKKILSEAEISLVRKKCFEFGTLFPKYFPSKSIKRKIHELVFDVPFFISTHKTVGRFAEEEGESLHNSVKNFVGKLTGLWQFPKLDYAQFAKCRAQSRF